MAEITLVGLRVVREVAARGSFTAAAESLGYTQSAVSRQVAGMESASGAPLFKRAPRGVLLTEEGRVLLQHAGGALDQVESAQRELTGMRSPTTGRVRVGAFPTAVAALVPRALAAFRTQEAGVEVLLREGTTPAQLRRLASGTTELAVVSTLSGQPLADRRFAFEPLPDDPLLLAVARDHPLARRRSVPLDDLAHESWVASAATPGESFLDVLEGLDWQPRVEFVAREWTAKLGLVAAGLGVTIVPGLAASSLREDVALVRIRSEQPALRKLALATRSGGEPPPPHARAFADVLHEVAAELALEVQRRVRDR